MALADEKILNLKRASTELIRAVTGESEYLTTYHLQAVKEEISEV